MDKLAYFYPRGHEAHHKPGHPERPERLEAICRALEAAGWWQKYPHLEPISLERGLVETIHSKAYLLELEKSCRTGQSLDLDTYTTPDSWQLALNAAGGAAAIALAVWRREAKRGFALTRPPGHHATSSRGMGFCLLNNIALAAQILLSRSDGQYMPARRIAIIDLDLHHGNGTQQIFWQRGDVFFMSTHQSPFYPGTGDVYECGQGEGEGLNANFPLPPGTGDEGFLSVMRSIILPLLDRYQPEILLVSLGFDAHWRDPLGSLNLSAEGCGELIRDLTNWADKNCEGKIALFLEGGYDLQVGGACAQAVVAALLDEPWQDPLGSSPQKESTSWKDLVRLSQRLWKVA